MTNDELYALLEKIEWAAGDTTEGGRCPYCKGLQKESWSLKGHIITGHKSGCKLKHAIDYGVAG